MTDDYDPVLNPTIDIRAQDEVPLDLPLLLPFRIPLGHLDAPSYYGVVIDAVRHYKDRSRDNEWTLCGLPAQSVGEQSVRVTCQKCGDAHAELRR